VILVKNVALKRAVGIRDHFRERFSGFRNVKFGLIKLPLEG
jgi:hypothetical protein